MPDETGATVADQGTSTPLHAYKEGRQEDVEGDPTARDIVTEPVEEREDPDKHEP